LDPLTTVIHDHSYFGPRPDFSELDYKKILLENRLLREENLRLQKRCEKLLERQSLLKKGIQDLEVKVKRLSECAVDMTSFSPTAKSLFVNEVTNSKLKPNNRSYSKEVIDFSLIQKFYSNSGIF